MHPRDDVGHGEGLARAGDAEQHLVAPPCLAAPSASCVDRLRLIALRREVGDQLERCPRVAPRECIAEVAARSAATHPVEITEPDCAEMRARAEVKRRRAMMRAQMAAVIVPLSVLAGVAVAAARSGQGCSSSPS